MESENISSDVDGALPGRWEGIPIPEGYGIDSKGVFIPDRNPKTGKIDHIYICYSPIAISSKIMDIDNNEFWYKVTYINAFGETRHVDVIQEDLIKRVKLCNLANKGINIIDRKAGDLCEYFNKSIQECISQLPLKILVRTNGWKNGQKSFVLGTRMFSKPDVKQVIQLDNEETKGLSQKGSLENWVSGVKSVISDPVVRTKCYWAASAILLDILEAQSSIFHHFGDTSTGKTISSKVAFSMIGDPNKLKLAGHSTPNYLEDVANRNTDLPMFLDEISIQSVEVLHDVIYIISNGVGKGRAKKEGGVHVIKRWKTIVLSTGEKPIIDYAGFGGQQVRAFETRRKMAYMPDQIMIADDAINNNYGQVIDYYIRKLFERKDEIKIKYDSYRKIFTTSNSNTEKCMGSTFAVTALAGELLEEVFGEIGLETQDNLGLTMSFFNEMVKDKPVEPYPLKALRFLSDFIAQNRNNFVMHQESGVLCNLGSQERKPFKICGYMQDHYIDIIPNVANDALRNHKFDSSAVIKQWIEWNVLITNNNRNGYRASYKDENGDPIRPTVYRIDSIKMQDILENGI